MPPGQGVPFPPWPGTSIAMTLAVYDAAQAGVGGARSVMLRGLAPMVRDGAAQVWIDLAFEGTWHGHHAGSFTFSREVFETIVANFRRNPNPIPLDYEHATEHAIPAPASGWVQDVEVRDMGGVAHLFALVELTDEAAQWIREGRYRFSSAVVDFASRDLASGDGIGAELLSIALTNVPFIRGQAPIRLSRAAAVALSGDTSMSKIKKADFLSRLRKIEGDEITPDQIAKLAQSMALLDEAMAGGGESEPEPAEDAEMTAETEEPTAMSATLAADAPTEPVVAAEAPPPESDPAATEAASLLEQAMAATGLDLAGLIEALKAMAGGGDASAATMPLSANDAVKRLNRRVAALTEENVSLKSENAKIKAKAADDKELADAQVATLKATNADQSAELTVYREREADQAVDLLIQSGRILDDQRPIWRKTFLSNRAQFDELTAGLTSVVPVGQHALSQTPPTEATPAINEDDPFVKERRRILSGTWLGQRGKDAVDAAIRRELAARNTNGVRV